MKLQILIILSFFSITQLFAQTDFPDSIYQTECILFINPETSPEFPGGYDSLNSFIYRNNLLKNSQQPCSGKIFIEFVVEKDGSLSNIKVLKGLNTVCDREAERLVSILPHFKPGLQSGIPVKMRMVLPINF